MQQEGGAAGGELYQVTFNGDLVALLRNAAKQRAQGQLLHPHEWAAYAQVRTHRTACCCCCAASARGRALRYALA